MYVNPELSFQSLSGPSNFRFHLNLCRTSTRPIPQVNLKDRIAALEQRKAAEQQHATLTPPVLPANSRVGTLRDKIASFEKQGAVPVPRGSFGFGAPPVDDGSTKRKGELYGNRVPGLSKPTIESVAAARKRTVSTSHTPSPSISFSRPVTPSLLDSYDENPLPPLLNVDDGESRLPSAVTSTGRRAVSDALPQRQTLIEPEAAPTPEAEEKEENAENVELTQVEQEEHPQPDEHIAVSDAPAIVVSDEPRSPQTPSPLAVDEVDTSVSPIPGNVSKPVEEAQEASPVSPAPSERVEEYDDKTPISASPISPAHSAPLRSPDISLHVEIALQSPIQGLSSTISETPSDIAASPRDIPSTTSSIVPSPLQTAATNDLPITNQVDVVSPVSSTQSVSIPGLASANTSPLPTPADSVFSQVSVATEISSVAADVSSPPPPLSAVFEAQVTSPVTPQTAQSVLSDASYYPQTPDVADESLTLDTSDAVIVKHPFIVSPTVTQGRLVPAPRPSNPTPPITPLSANTVSSPATTGSSSGSPVKRFNTTSRNLPPLVSPTPSEDLFSLNKHDAQPSFHAVVHERVRQTSGSAASSPVDGPSLAAPRAINVLRTVGKVEPDSPKFSDLADLVLDAALLEQQLSAIPPPTPKASSPLTQSTGPTTPEKEYASHEDLATPEKPTTPENKQTAERAPAPAAPPPTVPLPEAPKTPVRRESLAHYRRSRAEPSQELPESVDTDGPSQVESDLAKEMGIQFTKSWNPSFTLPSPASSSLPYLTSTPPDSPTTARRTYGTPGRSSLTASTPVRMRTISHSPLPSPQHATPTRVRTISHHNLSRSSTAMEDVPPTPPPKSPRKYLTSLRRKPTMPGTYPRTSGSSEDSSVYISAPPSPPPPVPPHDRESIYGGGSDASSIMSSTRSMKSKFKESSLSRATSVMDRLWRRGKNKHSTSNAHVTVVDTGKSHRDYRSGPPLMLS